MNMIQKEIILFDTSMKLLYKIFLHKIISLLKKTRPKFKSHYSLFYFFISTHLALKKFLHIASRLFLISIILSFYSLSISATPTLPQKIDYEKHLSPPPLLFKGNISLLKEKIQTLAIKRANPSFQITLFNKKENLNFNYGHADASSLKKIDSESVYQSGILIRPLIAYSILKLLEQKKETIDGLSLENLGKSPFTSLVIPFKTHQIEKKIPIRFYLKNQYPKLRHFLNMSSGLPLSKINIYPKDGPQPKEETIANDLIFNEVAGAHIQESPFSYKLAQDIIEKLTQKNLLEEVHKELKRLEIFKFCIERYSYLCPKETIQKNLAQPLIGISQLKKKKKGLQLEKDEPLTSMKIKYFPVTEVENFIPLTSLYTSSQAYAKLLQKLWSKAFIKNEAIAQILFEPSFQYHPYLGGAGNGFFFKNIANRNLNTSIEAKNLFAQKTKNRLFYSSSFLPGYSSLAFIADSGEGGVIFTNMDDPFFLFEVEKLILDFFQLSHIKMKTNENLNQIQDIKELVGAYKPLHALPKKYDIFDFLHEVQIRIHNNTLELSNVFEKEILIHLLPIKKDLYLIQGPVEMNGWHLHVRRDEKDRVIGFDTDLRSYNKISKFFSAQSFIIYMALVLASPLFFAILYFSRPRA